MGIRCVSDLNVHGLSLEGLSVNIVIKPIN